MDKTSFDKLLLKTAFCCVVCDGNLDPKEIEMLKSVFAKNPIYAKINFDKKINSFIELYNEKGKDFFTFYFDILKNAVLSEEEELSIIDIALKTINADDKIEYSEIKFFKVIRTNLKISNEKILSVFPDIEQFLEQDLMTESYLDKLTSQYLDSSELKEIEFISSFDADKPGGLTDKY